VDTKFRHPAGPIPRLSDNAAKVLHAERDKQVQIDRVEASDYSTDPANILGFELPADYQPRTAVEGPVKQWCAAAGNLSALHYVWGGSGAGKTTTLGWLFRAAFNGELREGIVPVWLQLAPKPHPLEAAKALVESLARLSPTDPAVKEAGDLVANAEERLR
jgi:hypothetical protein